MSGYVTLKNINITVYKYVTAKQIKVIKVGHHVALFLMVIVSLSNGNIGKYQTINILLDVLVCSIAVYFYELCRILTSP